MPKVLQPICGREMVGLVADALRGAGLQDLVVIVPPNTPDVGDAVGLHSTLVEQTQPLGTAHALSQARSDLADFHGNVLVINGDVPLVTSRTLSAISRHHESTGGHLTILTSTGGPTEGLGRVVRGESGDVMAIVEEAERKREEAMTLEEDSSGKRKSVPEINVGVYCFKSPWLWSALDNLSPSSKGELYLTDLIGVAAAQGHRVGSMALEDPAEGLGVNDGIQLATAREVVQRRVNRGWLLMGVNVMEPAFIDITVELEPDTVVHPNTFLQGRTRIGRGCQIGPSSVVVNSVIADGCRVLFSVVEEATLEDGVDVGPYSHIRPETYIEREVHIGNFSEVKNSRLGKGTKIGHFSYVGDARVGPGVNIGAGTVTCNFDGVRKNETEIGEGAFIGSDSMLVAPVRIGAGAVTGAGSVVNRDVPPGATVVGAPAREIPTEGTQKGQR